MRLRVLSYNIHKCIGGIDRRYQPDRVVATIAHYQPDIVMLQEVDAGARRSSLHHQSDMLGEALELPHRAWFPNVALRSGGHYGNAILSRFPCREALNIDLSLPGRKARSVLHAVLRVRHDEADHTVHVFNLHLGLRQDDRRRHRGEETNVVESEVAHQHPVRLARKISFIFRNLRRFRRGIARRWKTSRKRAFHRRQ